MALFLSKRLSIEGNSLRNRLTVVVALVFILPFLIFFHVLYEEGLIIKFIYHYAIVIVPLLFLSLLGLILLRQVFDKFMLITDFMKKADAGEFVAMDIHKDAAELRDISISFNSILKKFQETSRQLEETTLKLNQEISMRRIAEENFKINSERFRAVAERAADAIICLEAPDNVVLWNKKAEEMFGYSADEIMGKSMHEMIVPEKFREKSKEGLNRFFKTGTGAVVGTTIELSALRKDGRNFPIELSISAMNMQGKWQAVGIVRDITERKLVWDAVEKAKKEWEASFDAISDPIFIHDKEFKVVRANKAYQGAAGLPFKQIIGRPYYEVFPKMDGPFKMCQKALELQEDEYEEIFLPDIDKIFKTRFYPVKDAQGNYLYSAHVLEDVTEARKAEEEIKSAHEYARGIIESSLDMIIAVDNERRITEFNKAAQDAFGYSFEEVIGKSVDMLYAEPDIGLKIHKTTIENGKVVQEVVNRRRNGELFPSLISASILYDLQGSISGVMGVSRDITERKEAEDALKKSEANLKRAQEVAHIGSWHLDIIKNELTWSDETYRMFKIPIGTPLTYEKFIETVHPDDREYVDKKWTAALKKEPYDIEHRIFAEGEMKWVREKAEVEFNEKGRAVKGTGTVQDITDKKKVEEKIKQEMEITSHLLMIAEATAHTTDIDKLMQQAAVCARKIMKSDACLSYLWEEDIRRFMPIHAAGLPDEMLPRFRVEHLAEGMEFVKKAARERDAVISYAPFTDEDAASKHVPWLKDFRTMVAIPLLGRRKPLGLIISIYKKPVEFDDRDKKIFKGISNQVSTAVEEAWHYKEGLDKAMELSHKIETIQVMHDIDKTILSTLNPQEILETACRMISRLVSCDRVTIALVDNEKKGFRYAVGAGDDTAIKNLAFAAFEDTSASKILKTGMPEYAANLSEPSNLLLVEKKLLDAGFLSHIRMPIKVRGEIIGILTVGAKRPSAFTPEDLSTLEKIASQIGVALENARLLADLENLFVGTVKSLSSAIDAKSKWTAGHSERVAEIAIKIGREMGLNEKELKDLEISAFLHDIGKIGTYEYILDKPEKLSDEELNMMKTHTVKGAEILEPIKQLKDIIPAVKHHHEFYDGTGYPDGLKGEDIPFLARIIGVADAIDAMGADRPYRKGKTMDEIIAELKRCSGIQFDSKVVEGFLKTIKL